MSLGYICQINNYSFIEHYDFIGIVEGGILRAFCGLCFGITAWTISHKIKSLPMNKNARILLTVTEAVLYLIFFGAWFLQKNDKVMVSASLILPVAIAITFSEQSYICKLFHYKWMKYFSPFSLTIYLNHMCARHLTGLFFEDESYALCISMMALFTVIACLLNFVIVRSGRLLWNYKLKGLFMKPDDAQ